MVELSKFFELTSDLMSVASIDGRFQAVNSAFERVLGYAPEEMCDRSFLDLVHPDDCASSRAQLARLTASQLADNPPTTVRFVNRCACKDGEWRQLEWTISNADAVLYCVGHDITKRMDNLARYKLLADHSTDIISRQTTAGEYLYVSPACYEVLGYYPDELIGRNRYDFIHPEDAICIQQTIARIEQQPETFSLVFRARHKAGRYVWMEAIQRKLYKADNADDYRPTVQQSVQQSAIAEAAKAETTKVETLETKTSETKTSGTKTSETKTSGTKLSGTKLLETKTAKATSEIVVVARNITQRVLAQQKVQQFNTELEGRVSRRTKELEDSEARYLQLLKIEREGHARAELARATAQLYAEAVENMQVGLYIWRLEDFEDPSSLTMVATNPAASQFTGVQKDRVIGQKILDAFPSLADTDILETYAGVVKKQIMVDLGEVAYGDNQIEQSIFAVKAFPLLEDYVGVSFENITQRKEAEVVRLDQAAQLKILFDQSAVGIGRASLDGEWIQVNQRLCDLLGYSMPELLGKSYQAITHPEDLGISAALYEQLVGQRRSQVSYEKRYITRSGDVLWAYVTVSTFYEASRKASLNRLDSHTQTEQETPYFVVTVQDITERKKATTALERQKNDLVAINTMLTDTMSQLEQRNQELDQFAYVTSHDLKAPLRAIANLASWIEEDLGDKLPEENKEQFDLLKSRVLRMEGFINGLLEYSRIGRTHQSSETVDTAALVAEVIDSLSPPDEFSIETVPPLPVLKAKRVPLIQVFSNLINNALKHHDRKEGRVKVSAVEHENSYEFLIADDGPGIDAAYHDKIFAIFQTLQSRDQLESTGIGLSLVKKTVEAEGGEVAVRSQVGEGATFSFTWPKEPHDLETTPRRVVSRS